jgi:predicted Fe-Mo cluster-binding NifX family protein
MKTVITSTGKKLDATFDLRFGRAAWFCLLDEESGSTTFIENEQAEAFHGAGSKVAEKMVELGVGKVISGDFGPKAKEMLEKFNIQMVILNDEKLTIREIIKKMNH